MKCDGRLFPATVTILLWTSFLCAQEPSTAGNRAVWQRYVFDGGALSIMSPVRLDSVNTQTENETIARQLTYMGSIGLVTFTTSYLILRTNADTWSSPAKERFVRGLWDGMESSYKEQIKGDPNNWTVQLNEMKSATVSGLPATDFVYKVGPSAGNLRVVLSGHRCYLGSVFSSREDHSYVAEKFFRSFAITAAQKHRE